MPSEVIMKNSNLKISRAWVGGGGGGGVGGVSKF